jgi:hypothetical protein
MCLLIYLAYVFTKTLYAYSLRQLYVYLPIHCIYWDLYMYLPSYMAYVFTKTLCASSLRHIICIYWDAMYLLGHCACIYWYTVYLPRHSTCTYWCSVFTETLCMCLLRHLYIYLPILCITETLCTCIYWDICVYIYRYTAFIEAIYVYLLRNSVHLFTETSVYVFSDIMCIYWDTLCMYLLRHLYMYSAKLCAFTETLCMYLLRQLYMYLPVHCAFIETLCACIYWGTLYRYFLSCRVWLIEPEAATATKNVHQLFLFIRNPFI